MCNVTIREVAESDFARIRDIAAAAWKTTYQWRRNVMDAGMYRAIYGDGHPEKGRRVEQWCRKNPELTRVAEIAGAVVGFVTWMIDYPVAGCGEISNNAVAPSAQGRGVGRAMYEWVFDEFRRRGMTFACVRTNLDPGHAPARAAYRKVGFAHAIEGVQYFRRL